MSPRETTLDKFAHLHHVLFLPLFYAKNKFSQPTEPTTRPKDVFEDATLSENGTTLANLTHYNDFPILELYSSDPKLRAQSQMRLMAPYMNKFYLQYVQFLETYARLLSGVWYHSAVKHTNLEIARRKLDLSTIEAELEVFSSEYNAFVDKYNESQSYFLKQKHLTIDEFRSLIGFNDVFKGLACSAAVETELLENGERVNRLTRTLDWPSLQALSKNSLGLLYLTGHTQADKPKAVLSIGVTPGLLGITVANDRGLVIAMNEVCRTKTKRENDAPSAIPQVLLIKLLAENCSTIAEMQKFLETYQPASSHILTAIDATGNGGVFEMLPNEGVFAKQKFRFRSYDQKPQQQNQLGFFHAHATNHFLDENGKPIMSSRVSDHTNSFLRYNNMQAALDKHADPMEVAKSVNAYDTTQAMVFTHASGKLKLALNVADAYAATAVKEDKAVHYTILDLTKMFADFLQKPVHLEKVRAERAGVGYT